MRVCFTKWGGRPHWQHDAVVLGHDEHGTWLGVPAGTTMARPGLQITAPQAFVSLVPRARPFVATFYDDSAAPVPDMPSWGMVEVYVDITTVPVWRRDVVSAVDLDLDVVRSRTGRVWVDDEDEFAVHRLELGYPDEVVRLASESCTAVVAEVAARRVPYDGLVGRSWINELMTRCAS